MVEQRWLGKTKRGEGNLALQYPPCVIDEVTDSFFAAPLLSIDESVIRAFPVDPFDVARTRRRRTVSATDAEALIARVEDVAAPAPLERFVPPSHVRLPPSAPSSSEVGIAQYAAPESDPAMAPVAPVVSAPAIVVAPVLAKKKASRGWLAGSLLALTGVVLGGALVWAGLARAGDVSNAPSPTVVSAR